MTRITPKDTKLGFIGIGYMGRPIAQRLLDAGFSLKAFDKSREKAEALVQHGGMLADDVADVAFGCDVLLSCLPSDDAVLSTFLGPEGALATMRRGSLVIEMSTISPETARDVAAHGSNHGVKVLDVTISGSTPVAEQGLLVLFGGGDQLCFQAAKPIFRAIARRHFYVGPSGSGATMKLVVNALLGIGMQAIAEAVALGEKAGLERDRLLEVLSQTAVVAPAHVGKLKSMAIGDFKAQFPLRLMNKDFGLILGLAEVVGARMPATEAAFGINTRRIEEGREEDFSAVVLEMEKQHNLPSIEQSRS